MTNRGEGMACPIDGTPLVMSERQNIEIDYCPTCRGVWLDRGELDKIIERSLADEAPARASAAPEPPRAPAAAPWGNDRGHSHDQAHYGHGHHKKRRKSFLEELFD